MISRLYTLSAFYIEVVDESSVNKKVTERGRRERERERKRERERERERKRGRG